MNDPDLMIRISPEDLKRLVDAHNENGFRDGILGAISTICEYAGGFDEDGAEEKFADGCAQLLMKILEKSQ